MIFYIQKPGEAGTMSQAGFSEGEGLIKWAEPEVAKVAQEVLCSTKVYSTHKSRATVYSKSCAKHKKEEPKGFLLHQSK